MWIEMPVQWFNFEKWAGVIALLKLFYDYILDKCTWILLYYQARQFDKNFIKSIAIFRYEFQYMLNFLYCTYGKSY